MMSLHLYLGFILANAILMLIPGPNVALITANSVAYGTRYGLLTVAGTTTGAGVQLALAVIGMSAALAAVSQLLTIVHWGGIAYLIWLGFRQFRAEPVDLTRIRAEPKSGRGIYGRAVLVAISNPKTLLFFGVLLPQFIDPRLPAGPQLALLAATLLAMAILLDGAWAVAAGRARALLARHGRLRNRVSGGLLMTAGVGLALAQRSR
jgi:threonine/homoserine/homoserine lactone efflux protein